MSRTNYSAYMAIKKQVLEIFKTETFEKNKLPSEAALAERLGISLVTLREALLMLALEGYVTKRHGSGNYVHPSTLDYENRSYYFVECLKKDGYDTEIRLMNQSWQKAGEELSQALKIQSGDVVLRNQIVYLANDKPAVLTYGHIPEKLLVRRDVAHMSFDQIHTLVHDYCQRDVAHSLNEYLPMGLPKELSGLFGLLEGTPIIASKQVFYDVQDTPVVYNIHYFYPGIYKVKTLQNWDLGV
ncbi:MAG: GntR family transcriptional regulator [Oscillospiraceae bacterium]|nr:GntR family transcriptional regulator [Oscillospiraceae bacterium]